VRKVAFKKVQCSSCGQLVDVAECYELYVGLGNYQLICLTCQEKPFKEVMRNLEKGKVYRPGEY